MHFGIEVVPFGTHADPRAIARFAQAAEAAGWEGLWLWDHVMFPWGAGDPWVMLAAAACATKRLVLAGHGLAGRGRCAAPGRRAGLHPRAGLRAPCRAATAPRGVAAPAAARTPAYRLNPRGSSGSQAARAGSLVRAPIPTCAGCFP